MSNIIYCDECREPIAVTESSMPLPTFLCMDCGAEEVARDP
jgi:predicted RNA-binding Zn-ribbon protein involved in translation (DUF1610 family)